MYVTRSTILATSAPFTPKGSAEVTTVARHAAELAGVSGRAPKVCFVGTARGDQVDRIAEARSAGFAAGFEMSHLALFPQPNVGDVEGFLCDQDAIWVEGGSTANLLAVWALHQVDSAMRTAWNAGVVLAGHSAGSICWSAGGPTDSYGQELQLVHNTLNLIPFGNCPHYDSEPQRRPSVHAAVAAGALPETHCTDDGVGLMYTGTELVAAIGSRGAAGAYAVTVSNGSVSEEPLEVTRLS